MSECATGDAVYIGTIGQVVGFFERGIDGILSDIAAAILGAAVELFANLGNIPTLGSPGINDSIRSQTNWLVVTIAVASLLAAAFRMALERKGQPLVVTLMGLVRLVITVSAAWWVADWLAKEADSYSQHLYDQGIKAQLKLIANCGTDGLTAFLLIIVGLLLLIAGCIHVILMYIRLGVMVLLTGTLPLAAAASMTEMGGNWWRKHLAWMVAWLAFKPVVGLIMYSGAVMIGATSELSDGDQARHYKLAGVAILLMAAVALPALMRLVVPAMTSLGSGGGVGAGVGAGAAVASGAKKIAGAASGAAASAGRSRGASGGSSSAGTASGGGRPSGGSGGGSSGGSGGGSGGRPTGGGSGGGSSDGSGGGGSRTGRAARGAVGIAAATVGAAATAVQVAASTHKHASKIASGALPDRDRD
ncbi:hypothetical protein E0H26_14350 [Micromonospora zingiberis]|uniref:Type IV secretion system protein n=1 Tax=Micromonospora zingiberis TaxID=2053011 RepID=A0A4V2LWJ5_9ACTN|nr:hypothetical protein [Micromonospora zingiberis]TCB96795.1 hypothetical protein E0H26_14350 [Micromonospora zingiberis]